MSSLKAAPLPISRDDFFQPFPQFAGTLALCTLSATKASYKVSGIFGHTAPFTHGVINFLCNVKAAGAFAPGYWQIAVIRLACWPAMVAQKS
jgi:hypothetical protein